MNPLDRDARKQVLLTRIAFERVEVRRDLERLRNAVQVPLLVRAALGGGLAKSLFGSGRRKASGSEPAGWLSLAWSLVQRYKGTAALLGGAAPLLRRGRWKRLLGVCALAAIGSAAWFGWRAFRARNDAG